MFSLDTPFILSLDLQEFPLSDYHLERQNFEKEGVVV